MDHALKKTGIPFRQDADIQQQGRHGETLLKRERTPCRRRSVYEITTGHAAREGAVSHRATSGGEFENDGRGVSWVMSGTPTGKSRGEESAPKTEKAEDESGKLRKRLYIHGRHAERKRQAQDFQPETRKDGTLEKRKNSASTMPTPTRRTALGRLAMLNRRVPDSRNKSRRERTELWPETQFHVPARGIPFHVMMDIKI